MGSSNPTRIVRQSPSGRRLGKLGFARISISAPVAYTDGVDLIVPYDTIDDMSQGFGAIVKGGILNTPGAFRFTQGGVYLITNFLAADNLGTAIREGLILGSQSIAVAVETTVSAVSAVGNAVLSALTPVPAADVVTTFTCTGASGLLQVATCLIVQVG